MVDKIAGLARLIATLLAIVAGFVPAVFGNMNLPLVLVVLGLIAGLKYRPEGTVALLLVVLALPFIGTALANIPAIGAQLNAVALNIELAAASVAATVIAIRLFNNSKDYLTGLAPAAGTTHAGLTYLSLAAKSLAVEARLLAAPVSFELASTSLHGLVTVPRCPRPVIVNVICFGGGRPECRWSWPRAEGGRPV